MAEVKLVNIEKTYGKDIRVVKNISFDIKDKEFLVLVGPSGCGKSTCLRMIAGLEDITGGDLLIDNKRVNDLPPKDRDIAMVFQNYALYPHMTVYENMAFGLKLRKTDKNEINERVNSAAKILGLEEYLQRKPAALSGGQRQRVAVGRAIVRKPKVFLFDEPLSNLDAKLRVQMRTEISKLHANLEATMVYVTHDQTEAMTMGDRIVILRDGNIDQIDTPMNLYNFPANKFVAGFIGSPAMNFASGKIVQDAGLKFVDDGGVLKLDIKAKYVPRLEKFKDKAIILGIRPEDIHDVDPAKINSAANFSAIIEVVEPMGNEIFIYFNVDDVQMVGRLPSYLHAKMGEPLDLYFDNSKLHFFDADTEMVIS
jgi:multiple sugar transport system ATP-binding protein